ncbi:diguanylate cyclase [Massilia sp. CT11-108]|uniref:diguanylate cyclase n=1 Tax=Massilia sp. CT11-108 TaxID=3393900 RepID=UPI0039A76004
MSWTDMAVNGRILVVDDAMENIQILHGALQDEHEVLFAMDGPRALEIARTQQPDLILLDAVMPGMDGYAVCKELLAAPETSDIPVIFVTALKSPEDETRALGAGAADFISKPVNAAVVRARVRTQLTVKRQRDALRALILTDALTGVANRRHGEELLEKEIKRARRYRVPLALLSFDIDRFKVVNDTYGYPVGDVALRTVADTTRAVLRASDILVRSGGEEFHIIAPHTSAIDGLKMAEKVRVAIEQAEIPGCDHVTVSLGVAQLGEQESGDSLTQRTDAALARAKRAGRNCVELAMQ